MGSIRVILIGTTHPHIFSRLKYLHKREDIELLGYYERDESISSRMKDYTACKSYTDLDCLLAIPFDVAVIHGYDQDNAFYMQQAIEAGAKGIFVEKPGVSQPEQFNSVAEEITRKRIVFECGWEIHYSEPLRFARQVVSDGMLGSITTARFHGGCPGGAGEELWQSYPSSIGGFFYSIGGHTVESVVDIFGLPQRLVSSIRKLPTQQHHKGFSMMPNLFGPKIYDPIVSVGSLYHEDVASAILEYPNFNVTLDFTAWEPNNYCEEWAIDLYGTKGALHLTPDPPSGTLLLKEDSGKWKQGKHILFKSDDGSPKLLDAFEMQMKSFFDRLAGKSIQDRPCGEVLTRNLLMLYEAMYKSKDTQSWIDL
jgi:predicted dehydrogenase